MVHVAFVSSDYAHARIPRRLRRRVSGRASIAVYAADDLGDYLAAGAAPGSAAADPGRDISCPHASAARARQGAYVGEPMAMIVAESRYIAEDALRDVLVDLDPLDAVVDLEAAMADGAPRVHERSRDQCRGACRPAKGDYETAREQADLIVRRRFLYDRGASAAIENRAIVAEWDTRAEELTIWDTTQAPIPIRNGMAARLGLLESQVRVVAPFVGGGFGPKIMMFYPEELSCPGWRCASDVRSSGPRIAVRTSTRRRRSAARCTKPRWR